MNLEDNTKYKANNIYNVDSYKAIKDIPNKSIDLVYIDIPYEIAGNGGGCFGEKNREYHAEYYKVSTNTNNMDLGIDYSILDQLCRVMKRIYIYIWCSKQQIPTLLNYFLNKGCYYDLFTWHKTNPIPTCNNKYLSDTEYCLIFREAGTSVNNGSFKTKSKYYISSVNKLDKELYKHPTIKPLEMVKNHILNSTNENDLVLDCFLGSGTTAMACKELNRRYIGFEINKEYYNIALDRLNGISIQDRKKIDSGQLTIFDFGAQM